MAQMKTNITLKLDSNLLRQAKVLAAQEGTSISAMLTAQLEHLVRQRRDYERARIGLLPDFVKE